MSKADFDIITIHSVCSKARADFVPQRGGMMSSLCLQGSEGVSERLYLHDFVWDEHITDLPGGWPFLFPVCARLEHDGQRGCYVYAGKEYQLPIHGFAWNSPWQIAAVGEGFIELVLNENSKTIAQYPFRFEVRLRYELTASKLICKQQYTNNDTKCLPYSAGFHPYFLTPQNKKSAVIVDYQPTKRFVYNENLTQIIGETELFALPSSITNPQLNEQLTLVGQNKSTRLLFPDGDSLLMTALGVEDPNLFPYVQLYTMPEKPFFCVEPWMAYPNAMNSPHAMRWLEPGQTETGLLSLSVERLLNK